MPGTAGLSLPCVKSVADDKTYLLQRKRGGFVFLLELKMIKNSSRITQKNKQGVSYHDHRKNIFMSKSHLFQLHNMDGVSILLKTSG